MITDRQICALKYLIFRAKTESNLPKQILSLLIDESRNLTREVCLTLIENRNNYTEKEITSAVASFDVMQSSGGTTHLHELFAVVGSKFKFSLHFGDYDDQRTPRLVTAGQFGRYRASDMSDPSQATKDMLVRYTFWVAKKPCSPKADLVVASRADLEKIDLKKPGLYPSIETE